MEVVPINKLPAEMLERVFHLLPLRDRLAVVLVCKWWNEVGEAPGLWMWVRLVVKKDNLECMPRVLTFPRLRAVKSLQVRVVSEKLLHAIGKHPGLSEVVIKNLDNTPLTKQLATVLFTTIKYSLVLKSLTLSNNELMEMDDRLLAEAINQLEEVELCNTKLTNQQWEAIFDALGESCKLKTLRIDYNNLASVDAKRMARGINKLENVEISGSVLTNWQINNILISSLQKTSLKRLRIRRGDMEEGLLQRLSLVISDFRAI